MWEGAAVGIAIGAAAFIGIAGYGGKKGWDLYQQHFNSLLLGSSIRLIKYSFTRARGRRTKTLLLFYLLL